MKSDKLVLDATCGSRMIWFDKNNPLAIYIDKREERDIELCDGRKFSVKPDIIADFTELPFEDNQFYLVVFDPPHLIKIGDNAYLKIKYGRLESDWESVLKKGFYECMRVLKPGGTLIFKWNEYQIPVKKIISIIGEKPLFGNRSGKQSKTHWMAFLKLIKED